MYVVSRFQTQLGKAFPGLNGIFTIEAGQAEVVVLKAGSRKHAVEAQVMQAIQANECPDLFNAVLGCYKLAFG